MPADPAAGAGPGPAGWTVTARVEHVAGPAVLLLPRDGAMHGCEFLGRLPELSAEDGRIDLGNLYRLLRAPEGEGLVSSPWQAESGPARRVCQLTASGADLLDSWAGSLQGMRAGIDRFPAICAARR